MLNVITLHAFSAGLMNNSHTVVYMTRTRYACFSTYMLVDYVVYVYISVMIIIIAKQLVGGVWTKLTFCGPLTFGVRAISVT